MVVPSLYSNRIMQSVTVLIFVTLIIQNKNYNTYKTIIFQALIDQHIFINFRKTIHTVSPKRNQCELD